MSRAFFPGEEDGGGMPVRRRKEESSLFSGSPHLSSPGYKEEKEGRKGGKKPFVSLLFTRGILPFFAILRLRSTDFPPQG